MNFPSRSNQIDEAPHRRRGFTLIQFLVVIVILGVLIALLLPVHRSPRPAAYRVQCINNIRQIGLALHNYHDTFQAFPPAYTVDENGNPLHSWRTLILPFIDQGELYKKIDLTKPWDDPANADVIKSVVVPVYACPSHPNDVSRSHTTYMAVVTPHSCFRATEPRELSDITDDPGKTIMVIEVDPEQAVHWMSPQDANQQLVLRIGPKTKHAHAGGGHALFVDGSVKFLSEALPATARQALISIAGGEAVEP